MDFRLLSPAYLGGPTYVPDHLGVLRSPGANLPAVQGMRLGWVEGPELVANPSFDVGSVDWTLSGGASIAEGRLTLMLTTTELQYAHQSYDLQAYKTYTIVVDVEAISAGGLFTLGSGVGTNWYSAINNLALGVNSYTVFVPILFANIGIKRALGTSSGSSIIISSFSIKEVIPTYVNTDDSGNAILPSTPQKTVAYNTDWTAKTFAETFDKFDISDPLKAPGWLCEPPRTNVALPSAAPATHTTGTLAAGTYTLWQEGTGSIVATAGTAVGTFGTASNGTPATITITTAGTVVLTASGINTWVQLELGAFKTSRIYTTTTPVTRAATVASFPTTGKIPVNNFAIRMIVVPRASGQTGYIFGSRKDGSNNFALLLEPTAIQAIKTSGGVNTYLQCTTPNIIDSPIDFLFVSTTNKGMQAAARAYSGSWGVFTTGGPNSTESAKADVQVGNTYRLGSLEGSGSQFTGNISLFDCIPIPSGITDPMAWAKTHWGVA